MKLPEVIAHRGASHEAPENTLEAFELARSQGSDGVETDLRLTADGCVVCLHDADLRRVAGLKKTVRSLTLADIQSHDAGSWKSRRWREAHVPSLEQLLGAMPAHLHLVLELKEDDGLVSALIAMRGLLESRHVTFIAFDAEIIRRAKNAFPGLPACWLSNSHSGGNEGGCALRDRARELGADGVDLKFDTRFNAALLAPIQDAGLKVLTYTVNTPAGFRRCAELGIDAITSDRPAAAIRCLRNISA